MLSGDLEKVKTAFNDKNRKKFKDLVHYIKGVRLKITAIELEQYIKNSDNNAVIEAAL